MRPFARLMVVAAVAAAAAGTCTPANANMFDRLRGSLFGFNSAQQCAQAYYRGNESPLASSGLVWACAMRMSGTATGAQKDTARCYISALPGIASDIAAAQKMQSCFRFDDPLACAEAYHFGNESRLAENGIVWACAMALLERAPVAQKGVASCYFAVLPGTATDAEAEQKMQACGG